MRLINRKSSPSLFSSYRRSNILSVIFYITSMLTVIAFIIIFCLNQASSRKEFMSILNETENFYTNNIYADIISINKSDSNKVLTNVYIFSNSSLNDDRINARLDLLNDRIVHYQKTSADTLNWWVGILSLLFILITGLNFYNFNEGKEKLEELIKTANKLIQEQKKTLDNSNKQKDSEAKPVGKILSLNDSVEVIQEKVGGTDGKKRDN